MISIRRLFQHRQYINTFKSINYSYPLLSTSSITLTKPHQNSPISKPHSKSVKPNLAQDAYSHTTEKQYFANISPDPDTFGDPSVTTEQLSLTDPDDIKEETFLTDAPTSSLSTKQYADIIKGFIRQRKIKEAIDVLEVRMLKQDRVQPENYIYNLLLGACGRVGYTKKAFMLFNNMKRRGLKPTDGTYTALFNACSNSPWLSTDGLTRATELRSLLHEAQYTPNDTTYNAMIKAFGRCGDIRTAFALVDERCAAGWILRDDTCNFLLQACVADKEAGFRHAILVWDRMRRERVTASVYTFNLLLRCLRDCGLGDVKIVEELLKTVLPENDKFWTDVNCKEITTADKSPNTPTSLSSPTTDTLITYNTPDLLTSPPRLGNIITLAHITRPEDKLLLIGGFSGYLRTMLAQNCLPDVRTFTLLLDSIPQTAVAEEEVINEMRKHSVQVDTEWCNVLIKRRAMRGEYNMAEDVLEIMESMNLEPDLITFGVLALGCKTKGEAERVVDKMRNSGYMINTEILGAMLHQAYYHTNVDYAVWILDTSTTLEIRPNKQFMQHLDKCKKKYKYISNDRSDPLSTKRSFTQNYMTFKLRYKSFVRDNEAIDDEQVHPWQQYRQETNTDVQYYKDTESRFKPRRKSYFMQKTSAKWSKEEKNNFIVRKIKDKATKKKLDGERAAKN